MTAYTAGEQVLIPAGKSPNWKPALTLADLRALAEMPRVLLQTVLLALTKGDDGIYYGGELDRTVTGADGKVRILIRHMAGAQRGRFVLYADAETEGLLTPPIALNTTADNQYVSVFVKATDIVIEGERTFRDDSLLNRPAGYVSENPTDAPLAVTVRSVSGIEAAIVQSRNPQTQLAGYLYRGYGLVPPTPAGTLPVVTNLTTVVDEPKTINAHKGRMTLDHPNGSAKARHLAAPVIGEGFNLTQDLNMAERSRELMAARGSHASLNARLSVTLGPDGNILTSGGLQTAVDRQLVKFIDLHALDPVKYPADEIPRPFVWDADRETLALNPEAVKSATGGFTKVSTTCLSDASLRGMSTEDWTYDEVEVPAGFNARACTPEDSSGDWGRRLFGIASFGALDREHDYDDFEQWIEFGEGRHRLGDDTAKLAEHSIGHMVCYMTAAEAGKTSPRTVCFYRGEHAKMMDGDVPDDKKFIFVGRCHFNYLLQGIETTE